MNAMPSGSWQSMDAALVSRHARPGESWEQAQKRLWREQTRGADTSGARAPEPEPEPPMPEHAPVDPRMARALVDSGLVPDELLDAFLAAPPLVRRRCIDSDQTVTRGALLEVDPIAELFPSMTKQQYEALRDDIAANGVQEPIWLYRGRIIDGRHRQRACIELGIDPPTRKYTGKDPLVFVVAKNLRRRHLTESQRAMVAASVANMRQGAQPGNSNATGATGKAEENEPANLPVRKKTGLDEVEENEPANLPLRSAVSQKDAAGMLNVSERSLRHARNVREQGVPALVAAVERGELAVSAAESIAQSLPPRLQERVVEAGLGKQAARYLRTHADILDDDEAWDSQTQESVFEQIASEEPNHRQESGQIEKAAGTLPEQPHKPGEWIAVSADLPSPGTETIVFLPGTPGTLDIARFEGPGRWDWVLRCGSYSVAPSHWMPRPADPAGGGDA